MKPIFLVISIQWNFIDLNFLLQSVTPDHTSLHWRSALAWLSIGNTKMRTMDFVFVELPTLLS